MKNDETNMINVGTNRAKLKDLGDSFSGCTCLFLHFLMHMA